MGTGRFDPDVHSHQRRAPYALTTGLGVQSRPLVGELPRVPLSEVGNPTSWVFGPSFSLMVRGLVRSPGPIKMKLMLLIV